MAARMQTSEQPHLSTQHWQQHPQGPQLLLRFFLQLGQQAGQLWQSLPAICDLMRHGLLQGRADVLAGGIGCLAATDTRADLWAALLVREEVSQLLTNFVS